MRERLTLDDLETGRVEATSLWQRLLERMRSAEKVVALTGAGISVESGVPDFRSPQGVWSRFPVEEYGTIEAFLSDPEKAWELYRAIWEDVGDKEPNPGHRALAELERRGLLAGLVTQNIDSLHQAAGSETVVEIHGDARRLQCLGCGRLEPAVPAAILADPDVPRCPTCRGPLKPNVVFFGEAVRGFDRIEALLEGCDVMLVAGTSLAVWPANSLPVAVAQRGGLVVSFDLSGDVAEGAAWLPGRELPDILVQGPAGRTLPALVRDL